MYCLLLSFLTGLDRVLGSPDRLDSPGEMNTIFYCDQICLMQTDSGLIHMLASAFSLDALGLIFIVILSRHT